MHARNAGHSETGLDALATVLAMHRIAVDPDQLRLELGHERPLDAADILRLAKRRDGVRAKRIATTAAKPARLPLPIIGGGPAGWFVIGRVAGRRRADPTSRYDVKRGCIDLECDKLWWREERPSV